MDSRVRAPGGPVDARRQPEASTCQADLGAMLGGLLQQQAGDRRRDTAVPGRLRSPRSLRGAGRQPAAGRRHRRSADRRDQARGADGGACHRADRTSLLLDLAGQGRRGQPEDNGLHRR